MSTPESKITPSSGAGAAAALPNSTAAVVPVTVSPVLAGVAREAAALARAPVVSLWIADEKARSLKVGAVKEIGRDRVGTGKSGELAADQTERLGEIRGGAQDPCNG